MDARARLVLQRRLATSRQVVWGLIGGLMAFYAYVQLGLGSHFAEKAKDQAVKNRVMPAPRGIIYDRNGNKLVDNHRALHLVIQREDIPSDPAQIEAVAAALELEPDVLRRKIANARAAAGNRMVLLQANLDEAGIARAELLRSRFPFLNIDVAPRRSYLGSDLAGHALGYVGEVSPDRLEKEKGRFQSGEIIGQSGFEAGRNDLLKGVDGTKRILVNNLGKEIALYGMQEPALGTSVYLTLDAGLQQVIKEAYGEEHGAAVVLDLRDGGVLALHSAPTLDPNVFLSKLSQADVDHYWFNPHKPMLNRVISGGYPPGSTFKLLMAIAALEKGIITPETRFHCVGSKSFYGHVHRCDAVHGTVNLVEAIAHSCDIYFYELANAGRLDVDDIHAAAAKYGITERTGIDLPNEKTSIVPSRAWVKRVRPREPKWQLGETISVAIGQGANWLTPLSLARFYALLGTRGKLLTPHLLLGPQNPKTGKVDPVPLPAPRETGLDPKIWAYLDEGLANVVKVGTAKAIAMPDLALCGKTGTAQVKKFENKAAYAKQAKHLKDHAWFAGYAPRENPQIAWAILVENGGFGAATAAPIARKLCEYWFKQRAVNPLPPPRERISDALFLEQQNRRPGPERPKNKEGEKPPEAPPTPPPPVLPEKKEGT